MANNTESHELSSFNQDLVNSQPSEITVNSSSQIHFGNSFAYNAPVIFNVDVMNMQGDKDLTRKFQFSKRSSGIIVLVITICTVIFSTVHLFVIKQNNSFEENMKYVTTEVTSEIIAPNNASETTTLRVTERTFIKKGPFTPVKQYTKLKLPIRAVVVCYRCKYPEHLVCHTKEDCNSKIWLMKRGMSSIRYNFMIAPNGFVFEGKGWYNKSASPYENVYNICFLQNKSVSNITSNQIESTENLIKTGIQEGKIEKNVNLYDDYELERGFTDPKILLNTTKQLPRYKQAIKIFGLFEWEGRNGVKVHHSAGKAFSTIVITDIPEYETCDTFTSCSDIMKKLRERDNCFSNCRQNFTVTPGFIRYNFVLGGSGLMFEGRGFLSIGDLADGSNLNTTFLNIGFIGNFTGKIPNQTTIDVFLAFIDQYQHLGNLDASLKIYAHSQISNFTNRPGKRFFELIKTWPFFNDTYGIKLNKEL